MKNFKPTDTKKSMGQPLPEKRPRPKTEPINLADESEAALPRRFPPRGVFRFNSHEEANEWMEKHTAPK
jgi:hypothetical protein